MGSSPTTPLARLLPAVVAALSFAALLAFALASPAPASATSVADASHALAADTQRLADSRQNLSSVRDELRTNGERQRTLRSQVEARLVTIYKSGGADVLAQAAVSGNVRDASTSLDTLNLVAEHDSASLKRYQTLCKRHHQLIDRRNKLQGDIAKASRAVQQGRSRLSKAYAAAAKARAELEALSLTKDSPVLPHAVSPEATVSRAALGNAGDASPAQQPVGYSQSGVASTYADSFTGQLTANGERYDPNAFTAASMTLPLGTWVNVTGPGGSIAVRINDRGPYVTGRIIDLSRVAANAVGLMGLGTVTLTVAA